MNLVGKMFKWHIIVKKPDSTIVVYPVSKDGKVENLQIKRQRKRNINKELQSLSAGTPVTSGPCSENDSSQGGYHSTQEGSSFTQESNDDSDEIYYELNSFEFCLFDDTN